MQVNHISFDGLDAVEIFTNTLRLVMVVGAGPRIAFLGRLGSDNNILYWDKNGAQNGDWKLLGGHRVWITRPGADESVDTYAEDNVPCTLQVDENTIVATAPVHPFTQLQRGIEVEPLADGSLRVTNFIKNCGSLIYSGGVWSPTCINPRGKVLRIPLGEENTTWDIVTVVTPRIFAGNVVRLDDPQVTYEGMDMVIRSQGHVTKRCAVAPKGMVAMEWPEENLCFCKHAEYSPQASYPLGGCNVALFVGEDNWMGELETFGPEKSIRPGETVCNTELWSVTSLAGR